MKSKLQKLFEQIINQVDEKKYKSMTMPLLGTGISSIDIGDGVESLCKALIKIIKNKNYKYLKTINLIEINPQNLLIIE